MQTHTHTHTTCTCNYPQLDWLCGRQYLVLAVVHSPHAWGEPSGGNHIGGHIGSSDASLILVLVCTTARSDYVGPIQKVSQQEVTRLVVRWQQEALSPQLHGPLSAAG